MIDDAEQAEEALSGEELEEVVGSGNPGAPDAPRVLGVGPDATIVEAPDAPKLM